MSDTTRTNVAPQLQNKSRLIAQTSGGPVLHDAAAQLLRIRLKQHLAQLPIDPDTTMLITPLWQTQGDRLESHSSRFESLTHALARQAFTQDSANYIEGEHFLTLSPADAEPVHLPVGMDAITTLLNETAPALFLGFAESQLHYWNETVDRQPRWQQLSDNLKNALNVHTANGWTADECSLARHVAQHPDKALRAKDSGGLTNLRARLVDLDLVFDMAESSRTRHLMLAGALVLTATAGNRELIALYTIEDGYESFDSMAQLGATLPERIDMDLSGRGLKWRLYEPDGNIFDAMVQALVGCQLDAIESLDPASRSPLARFGARQPYGEVIESQDNAHFEQLEQAIPEWLKNASLEDIQRYSRDLSALGSLRGGTGSDAFDITDVPLILDYAEQQMRDAILAEQPLEQVSPLRLDDLRITLTDSFEAGGFVLPDPHSIRELSLGEFALRNTPAYLTTIAYADGTSAPDWLTVKRLQRIASDVDIGKHYPQLIKRTLIDDPVQARRHKTRYCRQLPGLLSILALECKLKRQGDVDEQGYRLVRQLLDSITAQTPVAQRPVQIRPLAFVPRFRLGNTPDTVTNMYVIGPRDGSSGPCLLYRPLLEQPLRQFPSAQNLLYAFYQPGELQDSVLAWLPTRALSFEYAQYVFSSGLPSPWTVTELAFEPFIHLDLTPAVDLANTPLNGDVFATLFASHSQAMADLADRQSTSNAERRWNLLVDSGWAMFGVAANFLSGPTGAAIWVWQTISQIQQALDAHEQGATSVEWSSVGDVLLALSILLVQKSAIRRIQPSGPRSENTAGYRLRSDRLPTIALPHESAPSVVHDPVELTSVDRAPQPSLLVSTPLTRNTQASFLLTIERLKVPRPALAATAQANARHLYEFAGKLYAQVGERWFQVRAEADEPVQILDPEHPARPGLCIQLDPKTLRWHWDLRLRLRGGGPTGRIEALRRKRAARKDEAWAALHRFIEQETTLKAGLDQALSPLDTGDQNTPLSEEAISTYIAKADELSTAYRQALAQLESWREAGGAGAFYQAQLMRMTVEQHRFLSGWMRMKLREYAHIVAPQINPLDPALARSRPVQMQTARKAIAVSDEMVERLEYLHSSLNTLQNHTGSTRKVAADLKRLMPSFTRRDLHANEIGMSIELSMLEAPDSVLEPLRELIGPIFENAADAGHQLVERRHPRKLNVEQMSSVVDRLADAQRRLEDVFAGSSAQLEPVRFQRIQYLVSDFHQIAREHLLKLLPEPQELPATVTARAEPTPSTSRATGKVNKSRPRIIETPRTASTETTTAPAREELPLIRTIARQPVATPNLSDEEMVSGAMQMLEELEPLIRRLRTDAQRPSRIPADMQDLFDQQATRLDQRATDIDAILARRRAELPVGSLATELREAAARSRREGISVYASMLTGRRPREIYLQWLHQHGLVQIVKNDHGRIRTTQRKDYFQEYQILDKRRQNKPLWVAHFHYDSLTDPSDRFTAAHLKIADGYLQDLPTKTRLELERFDAVDNALRRIVSPAIRDLFIHPRQQDPAAG
ncbi:dermonecrotic toxin domain-containing protein [Pseudomonas sp. NPDC087803]|uniref:dermonecrotic toxin domain-containing protein n=1 Tax=Pseudomonas sp. NPDC087803 TaxID=3364448 RepID=UPI00380D67BA